MNLVFNLESNLRGRVMLAFSTILAASICSTLVLLVDGFQLSFQLFSCFLFGPFLYGYPFLFTKDLILIVPCVFGVLFYLLRIGVANRICLVIAVTCWQVLGLLVAAA